MAKNSGSLSMPVDKPAMVEPRRIAHKESAFFAAPAAEGYDLEGFTGDTQLGAAKGNRNSSAFPTQASDKPPFARLRRR
jgi:hypothetical protein